MDQGEAAAAERGPEEEEEDKTSPMAVLPNDMLVDVLRRLPPRGLATSRCVCKAWLAAVDARRLLRADLLPISMAGFFLNFHNYGLSEFFSPRSESDVPSISGKHHYLPAEAGFDSWGSIDDHCNGLLLVHSCDGNAKESRYVLNPATRWMAPLAPTPPAAMEINGTFQVEYLAYDPADSPDFEVVSITRFCSMHKPGDYLYNSSRDALDPKIEQSEWPPSECILHVFSSRTALWEERCFAREGDSTGTVSDMRPDWPSDHRNAVYWRGALYVHCRTDCVMRISLSSDKYLMIKPPLGVEVEGYPQLYLGKSLKGVYFASIEGTCRLQVWNLNESGCQMEWVLMHDRDLSKWLLKHKLDDYPRPFADYGRNIRGPWVLEEVNRYYDEYDVDNDLGPSVEERFDWTASQASEDDEEFTWSSDDEHGDFGGYMDILGFHPCKEIIFLSESITRGLAYNLKSSKIEVLGNMYPEGYENEQENEQFLELSFPYTPCWLTQTAGENS